MHYEVAKLFRGSRWLMEPQALAGLLTKVATLSADQIQAAIAAYAGRDRDREIELTRLGDVAVIEATGPITYRETWLTSYCGWPTIERLQAQIRLALADTSVKSIVIRWDSPGGVVDMVPELADELFAAKGVKPIYSVADTMICSAAYWLAAQTSAIYAPVSGQVGSIGVYTMHEDLSGYLKQMGVDVTFIFHGEHKVDANPYEPLSDAAKATLQASVDEVGALFDAAVARGRGVDVATVQAEFGQGQVFSGRRAQRLGLTDKMGTFTQVVSKLTKGAARGLMMGASAEGPDVLAETSTLPVVAADQEDDEGVEPQDGACPDGYEMDEESGRCYLAGQKKAVSEAEPQAVAAVADDFDADLERDRLALTLARG